MEKKKESPPARVTGIGGIFFKCRDPQATTAWYARHFGFATNEYGSLFEFRPAEQPDRKAYLQWSPFPADSDYFAPSASPFMINYRVSDIEALVADLRRNGVTVLDEIETFPYGRFVHVLDPDGNKVELWEPVDAPLADPGAGPATE